MGQVEADNQKVMKSGVWYMIGNFFTQAIGYLLVPVFTRLLTKSDFGYYNNFVSWLSLLSCVTGMGAHASLIRARYDYKKTLNSYVASILLINMINTLLIYGIAGLFYEQVLEALCMPPMYLHLLFAVLFVYPALTTFQMLQRLMYHYRLSVVVSVLTCIMSAILSLGLVWFMSDRLLGRVLGQMIPLLLVNIVLILFYFFKAGRLYKEQFVYILRVSLPFVPHLLGMQIMSVMDKTMITHFWGAEKNAVYSLSVSCVAISAILFQAMNNAFSPWLGECLHEKRYQDIRKFHYRYVFLFLCGILALLLVAPEIILIAGGKAYMDAFLTLPPLLFGVLCQFLYTLYVNIEQYEKKTIPMAIATSIAAAANFFLNWWLIPAFGYSAAAYTTAASYFLLLLLHYFVVRKMGFSTVYQTGFLVFCTALGGGCMFIFSKLGDLWYIRYILLLGILGSGISQGLSFLKKEKQRKSGKVIRPNIYACATPYHIMISVLRVLTGGEQAILLLYYECAEDSALVSRLQKSGIFMEVKICAATRTETRELFADRKQVYRHRKQVLENIEQNWHLSILDQGEVYLFYDADIVGYERMLRRKPYHLLEDGRDCYSLKQNQYTGKDTVKGFFKRMLGADLYEMGQSPCIQDLTVNDLSKVSGRRPYPILEMEADELLQKLTGEQKEILLTIFCENRTELEALQGKECLTLLLTQPLVEMGVTQTIKEQEAYYAKVLKEHGKGTVVIKRHPRDKADYHNIPEAIVLSSYRMPVELFQFAANLTFEKAITFCSTSLESIRDCGEKIILAPQYFSRCDSTGDNKSN